jgi:hypothetical protein
VRPPDDKGDGTNNLERLVCTTRAKRKTLSDVRREIKIRMSLVRLQRLNSAVRQLRVSMNCRGARSRVVD